MSDCPDRIGFEQELAFEPCGPSAVNETNTETPPATVSTSTSP